jgi:hypothetical protein
MAMIEVDIINERWMFGMVYKQISVVIFVMYNRNDTDDEMDNTKLISWAYDNSNRNNRLEMELSWRMALLCVCACVGSVR